ncbi:MAG: helix-hairpin-helix domain-containing protein [Prevotellaceae bacterium]|nr:helix-hairpin-helix domain-containing protein [Prevotellaceae bacterium]
MKKFLKIFFTFSKSERIGMAVLLVLLVAFQVMPHIFSSQDTMPDFSIFKQKIDSLSQILSTGESEMMEVSDVAYNYSKRYKSVQTPPASLFAFDPNTAGANTFERLGFSPKQAAAIVNYRAKGAVFRQPDDFKKVFVVTPERFEQLKPYIQIAEIFRTPPKTDSVYFPKRAAVMVELNTADTSELVKIRGVGAYTAAQIVKYREQLGGFATIGQLREIRNMTAERFEQIAAQVTVDTSLLTLIDLQTADRELLAKHPYIGAYAARGIVHFRSTQGVCDIDGLVKNNILDAGKAEQLRPYCRSGGQ